MADKGSASQKKVFHGGCHCGKAQYRAAIALPEPPETPIASRCNCTICLKTGFTSVRLEDEGDFTLLSPSSLEELSDYQFNVTTVHRYFCGHCGVQICGKGSYEYEGQTFTFFTFNILTLDQPQDGLDLSRFKIEYWDGRNDNWGGGKKESPWPGGCV